MILKKNFDQAWHTIKCLTSKRLESEKITLQGSIVFFDGVHCDSEDEGIGLCVHSRCLALLKLGNKWNFELRYSQKNKV